VRNAGFQHQRAQSLFQCGSFPKRQRQQYRLVTQFTHVGFRMADYALAQAAIAIQQTSLPDLRGQGLALRDCPTLAVKAAFIELAVHRPQTQFQLPTLPGAQPLLFWSPRRGKRHRRHQPMAVAPLDAHQRLLTDGRLQRDAAHLHHRHHVRHAA
jgi:hypothetical protein